MIRYEKYLYELFLIDKSSRTCEGSGFKNNGIKIIVQSFLLAENIRDWILDKYIFIISNL